MTATRATSRDNVQYMYCTRKGLLFFCTLPQKQREVESLSAFLSVEYTTAEVRRYGTAPSEVQYLYDLCKHPAQNWYVLRRDRETLPPPPRKRRPSATQQRLPFLFSDPNSKLMDSFLRYSTTTTGPRSDSSPTTNHMVLRIYT
jgi:hypothetical protein